MHDIFSGISDERVTDVIARPGVAAINSQAAGRRKVAGSASAGFDSLFQPLDPPLGAHHPPRLLRADAIQGGLRAIHRDVHRRIRHRVVGISVSIPPIEKLCHDVSVLPAKELSSVVVVAHAVLPFARLCHERHRPRIERKIAPERDRFRGWIIRIGDHPGEAVDEPVNLIVEPPGQTAEHPFGIERPGAISPAGQDHPLFIRHAVIVGVLVKKQIRNRSHKNSAAVTMNRRRPAQAVCKDGRFVETTVSIRILQPFDLAMMLLVALREVTHLNDKEPPILVERQCDRLSHQRFSRHELKAKARF